MPLATMKDGTLSTSIFNVFPPVGSAFTLDILFNGEVIYSADRGNASITRANDEPFTPELGRMLNIIIDFGGTLDVMAVITPWNVVYQIVEM